MVTDLLLETAKRRDYKLKIIWKCIKGCKLPTGILLHRTPEEVLNGSRNIKQRCYECKEISIPKKVCNKCLSIYSLDTFDCETCEPRIKQITEYELEIEENNKKISDGLSTEIDLVSLNKDLQKLANELKR